MDNENMNVDTFAHALAQLVEAYVEQSHLIQRSLNELAAAMNSALRAAMDAQFFASFGKGLSSGIVRDAGSFWPAAQKHNRARHIAHAAYGLRRKGSQGWRKR